MSYTNSLRQSVLSFYAVVSREEGWYPCYLSAEEMRGEVSVCSICCRWKAEILVITPSPLILSQLPFCFLLPLQGRACSSMGISVCSSSEQGSGPCQSHYITRPRQCSSAWPGWRDNYRRFVFPAFPFFLPSAAAAPPPPPQAGCVLMLYRRSLFAGNRQSTVVWSAAK